MSCQYTISCKYRKVSAISRSTFVHLQNGAVELRRINRRIDTKMFVKIGNYSINTDQIVHVKHEDDNDTVTVVFTDGSNLQWKAEDSKRLRQILDRMGGM
jgi:hypothetical protein